VHAALFLVLAFFNASCVWMLLRAEFLAITLGARVRRRGDGVVPVRRDDARHQHRPVLGHYLSLGAILFALSVIGIFLNRKQPDRAADGHRADAAGGQPELRGLLALPGRHGRQVFVFFILTVAAAESAIGLAILVVLFRNRATINVDELDTLKG
jgi:NADH-quinone oxidoreductase subunit K